MCEHELTAFISKSTSIFLLESLFATLFDHCLMNSDENFIQLDFWRKNKESEKEERGRETI